MLYHPPAELARGQKRATDQVPWELLTRWLATGYEESFRVHVLRPAHAAARAVLGDRREAWDVTVAALDRALLSVAPLVASLSGGQLPRDPDDHVWRLLSRAEVGGEPLFCAVLRARIVPAARRLAREARQNRAQVTRAASNGSPVAFESDDGADETVLEQHAGPEELAERHELVDCVRAAVESLHGNVRRAQELCLQGLSQRQIARELHLSRSAVRTRLELASQQLATRLHDAYG